MKLIITSMLMLTAAFAQASEETTIKNVPKLSCAVPMQDGSSKVSLEITLANDTSVDFVTLNLISPNTKNVLFIQLEKGSFEKQISKGAISTVVIEEGFSQENGVLKKAGFLTLNKDQEGDFSGMLMALGNIHPLVCSTVN